MEYVDGTPINKVPITASVFLQVQKAMSALWAGCVDHNDSHLDNILIDRRGHVYIIDFEFATRIPKHSQQQFISFLDMPGGVTSLNSAAQVFFTRHSNAIQFQRTNGKMTHYNPGYKALRVLWNRMSRDDRQRVTKTHGKKSLACAML
jgi:serine/threonine protein kinase